MSEIQFQELPVGHLFKIMKGGYKGRFFVRVKTMSNETLEVNALEVGEDLIVLDEYALVPNDTMVDDYGMARVVRPRPLPKSLTPQDYKDAILVQDACNLSGVAKSFSKMLEKIWAEARKQGKGTEWVNQHPICVLFVDKMASLSGGGVLGGAGFMHAYRVCQEEADKCT